MVFNADIPTAPSSLRVSNPQILANQAQLQVGLDSEHEFTGTAAATQTGRHTQGSAVSSYTDTASLPTTRPDGSAFDIDDLGRLAYDTDTYQLKTLTAIGPIVWTPVGGYIDRGDPDTVDLTDAPTIGWTDLDLRNNGGVPVGAKSAYIHCEITTAQAGVWSFRKNGNSNEIAVVEANTFTETSLTYAFNFVVAVDEDGVIEQKRSGFTSFSSPSITVLGWWY